MSNIPSVQALPCETALHSAAVAIRRNPEITRCTAARCDDMIAGGPLTGVAEPVPAEEMD